MSLANTVALIKALIKPELSDVKNAIAGMGEFVGDTETDIGQHEESSIIDYANFTPLTVTDDGITYVITKNQVSVIGTAGSTKLRTLQDNVLLQAGTYTFGIDSKPSKTGLQFQLYDITNAQNLADFSDIESRTSIDVTLAEATTVRIRVLMTGGTQFLEAEAHTLSLKTGTTEEVDNTLAYVANKGMSIIGDIETDLGQHSEKEITDYTNLSPVTVTDGDVSYVITKTHITANGLSNAQKLRTLQDNISCPAGDYIFSIGSKILSSGFNLQIYNITNSSMIRSLSSLDGLTEYAFTLSGTKSLRIRVLVDNGANVNEDHEIYLHKVVTKINDNTLIYMAKKGFALSEGIEGYTDNLTALKKNLFPICTFIDDDAIDVNNVTSYVDACDEAGIKGSMATLTIKWENNAELLEALKTAEQEGHSIIIHAYSQDINDCWSQSGFDEQECTENLIKGMQMMAKEGFINYKIWATPSSRDNEPLRTLARRAGIECKFIGENWANDGTHPVDRFRIYRCALNVSDATGMTIAQIKALADACYAVGGWLIIMTHFANENGNGDYADRLVEIANYVTTKGYKVANAAEAWSYRKWMYDLNDVF